MQINRDFLFMPDQWKIETNNTIFSIFSYYFLCLNANNNKYSIDICIYKIAKHLFLL